VIKDKEALTSTNMCWLLYPSHADSYLNLDLLLSSYTSKGLLLETKDWCVSSLEK